MAGESTKQYLLRAGLVGGLLVVCFAVGAFLWIFHTMHPDARSGYGVGFVIASFAKIYAVGSLVLAPVGIIDLFWRVEEGRFWRWLYRLGLLLSLPGLWFASILAGRLLRR